jgi:hypothetical protein
VDDEEEEEEISTKQTRGKRKNEGDKKDAKHRTK